MLVLIVALGSQVAAPCPHAGRAAGETDAGWRFYRRGAIAEAAAHFAAADSLCPGDHGAQVGLGFVRLRQGEARAAADHFLGATRSNAGDAEAWYGLGLARVRLGQRTAAAEAWRRTLRLAPGYEDAELQLLALGIDSGRSEEHTSELQSRLHLVCRLLLEKKKKKNSTKNNDQ